MVHLVVGLIFLMVAVIAVVKKYKTYKVKFAEGQISTIPGLPRTSLTEGNYEEIEMAGSLSLFLREMHERFGPIFSFWEGTTFAVSTSSPQMWEEQQHLFSLPDSYGEMFRPLCGDECFGVTSGERALHYRRIYDPFFSVRGISNFYNVCQEVSDEFIERWNGYSKDDQVALMDTMSQATMKALLLTLFGDYFRDEDKMERVRSKTEEIFAFLQIPPIPGSDDQKYFKDFIRTVHKILHHVIDLRRDEPVDEERPVFLDVLLEENMPEEQRIGDALLFLTAGYTTTTQLLTNIIYMLSINEEVQEKIYQEIHTVLGEDIPINQETVTCLSYLRQVVNETLRYIPTADFLFRSLDEELVLGEHKIPKGTNLYQALCVCFDDPSHFYDPDRYDPERFCPEHTARRHPFAFRPFGFAGGRQCPGANWTYIETTVFLANWCRQYRFNMVPGQTVTFVHGFTTRPAEEIWLTLESRKVEMEKIAYVA